jgi:hypothetical protein
MDNYVMMPFIFGTPLPHVNSIDDTALWHENVSDNGRHHMSGWGKTRLLRALEQREVETKCLHKKPGT